MKTMLSQTPIVRFVRNLSLCWIGLFAISASAQILFDTDFESDTIGQEPAGFALLGDTGFAGNSLNVIAANSFWSTGSQALQYLDTNITDSNPDIFVIDETPGLTQDVIIEFDFANISGSGLRFMVYDGSTRGIRLDLDNGGTIKNNGVGDTLEFTGTNQWHTIQITTNLASDTYDISIFREDRAEAKSFTGLAFENAIANIGTIRFQDFTGSSNTSEYYLDDISVTVVPEPGVYALMLGGLALLGVLVRRRTRR